MKVLNSKMNVCMYIAVCVWSNWCLQLSLFQASHRLFHPQAAIGKIFQVKPQAYQCSNVEQLKWEEGEVLIIY